MSVDGQQTVDDARRAQVEQLLAEVSAHDGRSPISEQGLLHLRHGATTGVLHLTEHGPGDSRDSDDPTGGRQGEGAVRLRGYAQLDMRPGGEPAAELAVRPADRRHGVGGALLDAVLRACPQARVWSHGLLPGAAELARSRGLAPVRELLMMERPLAAGDAFPAAFPPGYTVSTYEPEDAADWLRVNAAAFADHAEQGRVTAEDLAERMGQRWFDAAGFFLVRDAAGELAAFHWTKVEEGAGEVYVVGVAPTHQGLGLGKAVTAIGLRHLRDAGLPVVRLYVDGHNAAAITTYLKAGFGVAERDVQYARAMTR